MISRPVLGSTFALLSIAGAVLASGCGAGGVGEAVRPKEATAASGLGEAPCREAESSGEPLVVDWKPEQRGDLELLMKENVAIVSYSCSGFKLLKECKVDGTYGFLGMSKKEQVVQLTNADEVKANLPLGGIGISGEVARGSSLDVAMIMVGKVKTTWAKVQADELKGECDGATHFVKGAMVGAFVMQTGTKGQVKTAAQMFGAGGSGSSTSEKSVKNKDGDIADCAKASPDDKRAPAQCQAFIRLELKAIAPKKAATAAAEPPPPEPKAASAEVAAAEPTCPKGLVMAEGKCTEPANAAAYLCNASNANECVEQCGKGNGGSCGAAGALYVSGRGGAGRDEVKARELFNKGCTASDVKSCTNLGVLLAQGRGGAKDAAGAAKNFEKGCADADALACGMLGTLYQTGDGVAKDEAKATALLTKGCEGGNDHACGAAGKMLLAAKDMPKAIDFMKKACDGTQGQSCTDLGQIHETGGQGVSKNPIMAKLLYQRGCFRGSMQGCVDQGRLELGFGGNQDAAKRAFEMACNRNTLLGCAAMKVLFGGNRPVIGAIEAQELGKSCNAGNMRDCGAAGTLQIASGNKALGMPMIERACLAQDPLACAVKKKN
ncbi:MAG: sel1 repeat family protein [Labilithrix sp.]|nr:sel1 repeat family protein [Labilithrix sp.]